MKAEEERSRSLARWIQFDVASLSAGPAAGFEAWLRTTAGIVAMLLMLQLITGALLTFFYVPSTVSAYATVAFIEKVLPTGSWLRSLHAYGSAWLTLFLLLHLMQQLWRKSYHRRPVTWFASVVLLALVIANGATGYSLPWDARALFSTNIGEGIIGALPLVGEPARRWFIGGTEVSALTLSRLNALHVTIVPALILLTIAARLFIFRERFEDEAPKEITRRDFNQQLTRQSISSGIVFLTLALYAACVHAPLGPQADEAMPGYLPRPGAQFLWLFQLLKYLPGRIASTVALLLPALILFGLASLPFLNLKSRAKSTMRPRRKLGFALFTLVFTLFAALTSLAYIEDWRNPRVREQLARQAEDERVFRASPFEPQKFGAENNEVNAPATTNSQNAGATLPPGSPPAAYTANCAICHGTRGQGASIFPPLRGISAKPNRTVEDLILIMDNPLAYGLRPPMKSFADKMTEDEKHAVAEWIASLKKR